MEFKKKFLKVVYRNILSCFRLSHMNLRSNKKIIDESGTKGISLQTVLYQSVAQKVPQLIRKNLFLTIIPFKRIKPNPKTKEKIVAGSGMVFSIGLTR